MSAPNIMLDLETMGHSSNSALIEIGACVFSSGYGIGSEFSTMVNLQSCINVGMTVDASTIKWWMMQKWDARGRFKGNSKAPSIQQALMDFADWIPKGAIIWGNGSDFDNVILENAYLATGIPKPWPDFNNRCFRTMKKIFSDVQKPERQGTHHSALDDAKFQAEWILKIYKEKLA